MKKLIGVIVVLVAAGAFALGFQPKARAFVGMMCFGASGCGKCEVCVKEKTTDPSGTCMAVAGCH